ncbi:MAG: hypothetical protein EOP21_08890 [Hyphomicrobiales bacterium]|nr:MAG: hypothetical protein EOP21_08890 [Hyphomicrobiales bacterium]
MKSLIAARSLPPMLAVCLCTASAAATGFLPVGGVTRNEVRRAVDAHRSAQREEVQREEAAAGRRLTPAELAELRSQVRQQWTPRYDAPHAGAPSDHESPAPEPAANKRALTWPRSQRQ